MRTPPAEPSQRDRLIGIRDNLVHRIADARCVSRLGEVEGLDIGLTGRPHLSRGAAIRVRPTGRSAGEARHAAGAADRTA
ncbi:hypothetical protein [Streptomyces sp. NPDC004726]